MIAGSPEIIDVASAVAFERGVQRGSAIRATLADSVSIYTALFASVGIEEGAVRAYADSALEATERWVPTLAEEIRGVAAGSGMEIWKIAALNARTEILSTALGSKPGECSTIVSAGAAPVGAQTWDWHEELEQCWHLQRVSGNKHRYVGLTEHGILSKVGVNDAGVGIMLNILGHQADGPGGVPVHLVGAQVLAEASDLAEATAILIGAPVSTSSAITVLSPQGAVVVELSPLGAVVVTPQDGVLLHTNHFLDGQLALGEKPGLYDPDSQLRLGVLVERAAKLPLPTLAAELVPYLVSYPGDEAELCCVPAPGATLGNRWATLATITVDAGARAMTVTVGSPARAADAHVTRLVAH